MNNFFENSKNLKKVLILLKNNHVCAKQITGFLIRNNSECMNKKVLEGYFVN